MTYTIYIKLTTYCNLNCLHCYAAAHERYSMSNTQYLESLDAVIDFAQQHSADQIDVQFHGGEPFCSALDIDIAMRRFAAYSNIKSCITTNLCYQLSDVHIAIFRKMQPYSSQPCIMTSWDHEIRFETASQEQLWEENVRTLISNKIDVRPIVCLTTKLVNTWKPACLMAKFQSLGISTLNFERLTENGRLTSNLQLKPTNRVVDHYLYESYHAAKQLNMHIPLFESAEESMNGFLFGCRARKCMKHVITINPNQTLAACPNSYAMLIGKIENRKFQFDVRQQLLACKCEQKRHQRCYQCKYFKYCNGDCCQLSFDETGCPGMTELYSELYKKKMTF